MKYNLVYGTVSQAIDGEDECGDQYLVKELEDSTLIAIADGLGHGKEAAFAAKKAMQVVNASNQLSLVDLIKECHEALGDTRGVVMSLVKITNTTLSWLGVGNVVGLHWTVDKHQEAKAILLTGFGGIVGMNLPYLKLSTYEIAAGDTLIIVTDGISNEFTTLKPIQYSMPQIIAQSIMNTYRKKNDDALVLVAQWSAAEELLYGK